MVNNVSKEDFVHQKDGLPLTLDGNTKEKDNDLIQQYVSIVAPLIF